MKTSQPNSPRKKTLANGSGQYFSGYPTKSNTQSNKPIFVQSFKPAPIQTLQLMSESETQSSLKNRNPQKTISSRGQVNKAFFNNPIVNKRVTNKNNRNFTCGNAEKVFLAKSRRHITSMEANSFEKERGADINDKLNMTMVEESKYKKIVNSKNLITVNKKSNELKITDKEKAIYGDRFPKGYEKVSLLGRGGCALVWLGLKNNNKVAIKQFVKCNSLKSKADIDSCKVELAIGKLLSNNTTDSEKYPGIKNVITYLDIMEDTRDMWVVYKLGGASLTKELFEVKGDFFKGERLYRITHQSLYEAIRTDKKLLKQLLRGLIETLDLLQHHNIVHCDLKPDNILVSYDCKKLDVKIIDFGSAFIYGEGGVLRMTTPEYMPPECLEHMKAAKEDLKYLAHKTQPWSIDMWSTGAILLEIATGFPQWLSLKGLIKGTRKLLTGIGAFAVAGKDLGKTIKKQKHIVKTLNEMSRVLKQYD